jgi:hypothetical protein
VPAVSWGAPPSSDRATAAASVEDEEKPQSPFYFTRLTWGNAASTKIFGVGEDYIGGEDSMYVMSLQLNLRYYFLNATLDKAYVNVHLGLTAELTDNVNATTTTKHEPLFDDTIVGAGYSHTVYRSADKQVQTTPGVAASVVLPTSIASLNQGKYFSAGIAGNVIQALPLAGSKSDWFSDVLAVGTVAYSHLFSKYTTPSDTGPSAASLGAQNPVEAPDGTVSPLDQLSATRFQSEKLRLNLTYFLTIYKDLSFANTWEVLVPFKPAFTQTSVVISTGTAPLPQSPVSPNPITSFDVSLSYALFNTARVDLGYLNMTPELVDNAGRRVSVFYSPSAVFYGNVAVYFDSLIERAMNKTPADQRKKRIADNRFQRPVF